MMRGFRLLAAVSLAVPLTGCYGFVVPKPIPEWAERSGAEGAAATPRRLVRVPRDAASGAAAMVRNDATPVPRFTTYGAEWQAWQDAEDNRLRRRLNICSGC